MNNKYGIFSEDYREGFWNYARGKEYNPDKLFHRASNMGMYAMPLSDKSPFKSALKEHSLFRGLANVFAMKCDGRYITVQDCSDWANWLDENESVPLKDGVADFTEHPFGMHKLGALCKLPETFVLDAKFNIEKNVSVRLAKSFAKAETYAFTVGDGVKMPKGILNDEDGAEVGAETKALSYDDVIKLFFSVKPEYRKNAVWMMNDETALALRTLKDTDGNYVWNHSTDTILGKKVFINEYMPMVSVGAKPIAFGDFSYYSIVERGNATMKVIKEVLPKIDDVGYLAFEFLDAKLMRPEAIKVLQITK